MLYMFKKMSFFSLLLISIFTSKSGVLTKKNEQNFLDVFNGNAVASESPFEDYNGETSDFQRSLQTHNSEKRNPENPRPTLEVEKADAVWCTNPSKLITVTYKDTEVQCGKQYDSEYKLTDTFHKPPKVSLKNADSTQLYTLVMLDPDAPDRKNHLARNWLHWLLVDIGKNDITTGKEIVTYEPPEPPAGTGEHRYIFLLLRQEGDAANRYTGGRTRFDIKEYASEHNLLKAVTGFTYFTTQED